MIKHIHFTRIVNESNKKYGFAVTDDNENIYIPGPVVAMSELTQEDIGYRERADVIPDPSGRTDFIVTTILEDESRECAALREEVERLRSPTT